MMQHKFIILLASVLLLAACQKESEPFMTLSQSSLTATAAGGAFNIDVSANVRVRVLNDVDGWLKIDTLAVNGETTTLSFIIPDYDREYPRSGRVRFIGDKVEAVAFPVTQAAVVPEGISTRALDAEFDAGYVSLSVIENNPWTATSDNPLFVLEKTSGSGIGELKVTFPDNDGTEDRVAHITVTVNGKQHVCTITQRGNVPLGILADWNFSAMINESKATFGHTADKEVGFHDQYVAASTGTGKIEYYACDKSSYPGGGLTTLRGIGANGDPYVRGTVVGDYWLITAENGKRIPAGTTIGYSFITHFGNYTTNWWVLEYLDGEAWKPVSAMMEVEESANKGMSGAGVTYSAKVKYNITTREDAVGHACYDRISGRFTTSVDMTSIVLKFRPVGCVTLTKKSSEANFEKYIDKNDTQVESRFSAQQPNNEKGNQVKTYDQHLTIEFAAK